MKLFTFVPIAQSVAVRDALFAAGAGQIGPYSHCSYTAEGTGSFKGGEGTQPFAGKPGQLHEEKEIKLEVIFPAHLRLTVLRALFSAHPYEEVAYDLVAVANDYQAVGSGLQGELPAAMEESAFLYMLKTVFELPLVRHTPLLGKKIRKVAICGGAGSFLIPKALLAGADIYISADIKYHEFFEANNRLVLADIGHWESEQYTTNLLVDILQAKFPTFAVLKSVIKTNPVQYFLG